MRSAVADRHYHYVIVLTRRDIGNKKMRFCEECNTLLQLFCAWSDFGGKNGGHFIRRVVVTPRDRGTGKTGKAHKVVSVVISAAREQSQGWKKPSAQYCCSF